MRERDEWAVEIGTERIVRILDDTEYLYSQALLLSSASYLLIQHLGLYPVTAKDSLSRPCYFLHSMSLLKISLLLGKSFYHHHLFKFLASCRIQLIASLFQETCQLHMACYPYSTMSSAGSWTSLTHSWITPDTKWVVNKCASNDNYS